MLSKLLVTSVKPYLWIIGAIDQVPSNNIASLFLTEPQSSLKAPTMSGMGRIALKSAQTRTLSFELLLHMVTFSHITTSTSLLNAPFRTSMEDQPFTMQLKDWLANLLF